MKPATLALKVQIAVLERRREGICRLNAKLTRARDGASDEGGAS